MDKILLRLENNRKAVFQSYILNGLLLLLSILSYSVFMETIPAIPVASSIITVFVFFFYTLKKKNKYTKTYKHSLVEAILKEAFDNLYFEPKQGIPKSVIQSTGMMMMGNRYSSNDYIKGEYKGTDFEQSDVCIQQVTSNGKHTHVTTYFKGRWMIFEFNKNFAADLQVRESGFHYAKRKSGWFTPEEEKMNKLELEDSEFNKDFDVYAADEHEAYYILPPHIMQSIKSLRERTYGKLILCFSASRLHVGINSNDNAFEPPVFHPLNSSVIKSINEEINVITRFVDELKLDRNIYKQN